MKFQPGQSGNPNGQAKVKRFLAALDRAIAQDDGKMLRAAADKLLEQAAAGEAWAIQMLADRLDGKATQPIAGADDSPPIKHSLEVAFVKAARGTAGEAGSAVPAEPV